jgi:serine/threonine protein kinase
LNCYKGSIHYCAPEILNLTPYYGRFADIWSCGVVLFAMINGKLPFDSEIDCKIIEFVKKCQYVISDTVSRSAATLIQLMLNLNPRKRILPEDILRHEWFDDYQEFISFNNDVLE